MNNKVVIGGNLKLKNVVSGQAKLNNVISGTPKSMIQVKGSGMTNAVKEALLDCFEHVAWIDDDGQIYYQALYDALYARTLTSISAVFEQGQAVIYDDDSLDDLKQYLTVTAHYDDGTSAIITTYTLSGTLNPGTSSIQVSYENKKTYFTVNVTHRPGVVTITNTLNGCTTSNSDVSMTEGDPYSATITASSGYILTGASVSITMGGVDITSSAYNNGTISIAEVTGALVITITAALVTLVSISAVYTQSGTVFDTDTLDNLKADLVVTALYSDSTTETVPSTDYTLSGTLTEGTSTITVTYEGKTTSFSLTVVSWTLTWSYEDGGLPEVVAPNDWTATTTTGTPKPTITFDNGIKFVGRGGSHTITPKNYQTTEVGAIEFIANFNTVPSAGYNRFNVRATLNTATDTLIGFLFMNGVKINGSGSGYNFIPDTSINLGEDHKLRVERNASEGKVYLDGDLVYSGELRELSGTNNILISFVENTSTACTLYLKAIRFYHES